MGDRYPTEAGRGQGRALRTRHQLLQDDVLAGAHHTVVLGTWCNPDPVRCAEPPDRRGRTCPVVDWLKQHHGELQGAGILERLDAGQVHQQPWSPDRLRPTRRVSLSQSQFHGHFITGR